MSLCRARGFAFLDFCCHPFNDQHLFVSAMLECLMMHVHKITALDFNVQFNQRAGVFYQV